MMRSLFVLFDAGISAAIPSLAAVLPPAWQWAVVALCADESSEHRAIVPYGKGQSCQCPSAGCIRDAVVSALPDAARVVAVILRSSMRCVAHCADVVITTSNHAQWCRQQGIPARTAPDACQFPGLLAALVSSGTIPRRHQAHVYRNLLTQIE
ncbi:MAG: hypothetical protein N2663_06820 [Chlorobi bacterium]|nr:hypothetical protein [Chlorobiota bacterium]